MSEKPDKLTRQDLTIAQSLQSEIAALAANHQLIGETLNAKRETAKMQQRYFQLRYGLGEGDQIDIRTGRIMRITPAAPPAEAPIPETSDLADQEQ